MSTIVVIVIGEDGFQSGEGRSRANINIPGVQQELLEEVYKVLFKEDPKQDHRAFGDAILCKEVYYKIKDNCSNKIN